MTTLLHIECSPRKQRSASLEVARQFIDRYQQHHPQTRLETLDLWGMQLPEFDEEMLNAKYAGLNGTPLSPRQQTAWDQLKHLAAHLHRADILVLSVPLWNFSIPYKLKHFIDLVSQKDILFSFDPASGLQGLLQGKTAVAALCLRDGLFRTIRHTRQRASTFRNLTWPHGSTLSASTMCMS